MSDWLIVLLAAPLASFGEEPGNARRGSADRPSRSALIGLAGAALGVERADRDGQAALGASFLTATRTLQPGTPLTDFHTFQSLPASVGAVATRAHALARRSDLETSITRRDYRADGLWQAAYWQRPEAPVPLETLRSAFLRPRFVLFAGRKSCPLARPLSPLIMMTEDAEDAFLAHERHVEISLGRLAFDEASNVLAMDERIPTPTANRPTRLHRRNDEPGDRLRWHFSRRAERVHSMSRNAASDGEDVR